jgi:hypothetical protein
MNLNFIDMFFSGWQFRGSSPSFEEGDEITVTLSDYDENEESVYARIGDSVLYTEGDLSTDDIGKQVRAKVTEFEPNDHVGRIEVIQVVKESEF